MSTATQAQGTLELVGDYSVYLQSVPGRWNQAHIDEVLRNEQLWPEPLIQMNPSFEPNGWVDDRRERLLAASDVERRWPVHLNDRQHRLPYETQEARCELPWTGAAVFLNRTHPVVEGLAGGLRPSAPAPSPRAPLFYWFEPSANVAQANQFLPGGD